MTPEIPRIMEEAAYVPLVVHNHTRAKELVQILKDHGIEPELDPISTPACELVSIKVRKRNLPLAVKILECGPGYSPALVELQLAGLSGNLLIPVDFSPYSMLACKVGFELAQRLSLHPLILHTFMTPSSISNAPVNDLGAAMDEQELDLEVEQQMEGAAFIEMRKFATKLREARLAGKLANVKFSTMVRYGLPEEVILGYAKAYPPALIVMATRGRHKKKSDMIGSVTAEVIDSCRVPVFTVPEDYDFPGVKAIKKLALFCNMEASDLLTADALMRMFDYPEVDVTLIPVSEKHVGRLPERMDYLKEYFTSQFPVARFSTAIFSQKHFRTEMEEYLTQHDLELLVIPNKKKNIFSRIFNPGIAHRILFERDIPMLVLPI